MFGLQVTQTNKITMNILFYFSGVSIVFLIFQLIFPYKPPTDSDFNNIRENSNRYNKLEAWAILWIFLSVGFISFCVFLFGSQLREFFFPLEYDYIIEPTNSFWFFPGFLLGFGLIRIPMTFVYKLILKNEYELYIQFTNMKHGFDGEKIWKPIEKVITFAGIIIFILGLNWFVRIDKNNRIEINELFSINTKTYNITDILSINHYDKYLTKKGIEKNIEHFVIEMKDNYFLTTQEYSFFAISSDMLRLNKKIAKLSNDIGIEIKKHDSPIEF